MQLSPADIKEINDACPSEQGVFKEPYGIPVSIKQHVVYMRWTTGGVDGGSCWGTEHYNKNSEPKPKFKVLDLVLKKLKPDISFLQFREIEELVQTDGYDNDEYYGNSTEYSVEYIILSELISKLKTF